MKKISVLILSCVVLSLTLLLAACGGGSPNNNDDMMDTTQQMDDDDDNDGGDDGDDMTPDPPSHSDYDLSTVVNEDPPASYARQAHHGITDIGAEALHWSRLTPLDANKPDHHASRYIRGGGVTVGIVDSGTDLDHPDLVDNIVLGSGITVRGTFYLDPSSYAQGSGTDSHGTQVAGVIAAILNDFGLVGVAPEAKLLPINLLDDAEKTKRVSLAEAYAYITANKAFVVNNSWFVLSQWLRVQNKRDICGTSQKCWLRVPHAYDVDTAEKTLTDQEHTTIKDLNSVFNTVLSGAVTNPNHDVLLVFITANEGWNSHTGTVDVCRRENPKNCPKTELRLSDIDTADLEVSEVYVETVHTVTLDSTTTIPFPDRNSIGALNKAPADFDGVFGNNWLNVAAVDQNNIIADFSNGCGAAKANCLAAPGMNIRTLDTARRTPNPAFRDDRSKDTVTFSERRSKGTSFAAPHVSGAAALLKGAFPNLRAQDVLEILLESADGAGECAPEPGEKEDKTVSCTDDAYGHGILNVVDAFTPTSYIAVASPARLNAGGVDEGTFALADSRIELSPAFGAAAWQKESLAIGGLDNYGRVYYTQMDLSDGVFVVKPLWEDGDITGGGIYQSYASPLLRAQQSAAFMAQESLAGGQWQGQHDNMDYSLSYGARAQQRAIGWQQGSGRLSWNYLSGSDDVAASGFNTNESSWRLPFSAAAMHQFAGVFDFSDSTAGLPQVGISYGRSEDDGISQLASYAKWGSDDSGSLRLEGGYVQEKDGVLGASFAGGFALSPGETFYQRLSGRRQLFGVEWVADYVHARSKAAGDGGIVQSLKARSDAWTVGANRGRWSLQWSQPLAINAGSMALSYISGYTESGDYAVTDKRLDISSGNRLQRTTLLYMREATDDLTFAFSLDYLRNAPHRDYRKDAVIGAAAMRYTF